MAPTSPPKKQARGYLATPLTREERRTMDRLYREHGGLIKHMGRKMCAKYKAVLSEDIFSCIDIAFMKTCRAWDPAKGTFSTLLGVFCEGEIRHFIRDHNWSIRAPGAVRACGVRARFMLLAGSSLTEVCTALKTDEQSIKEALFAVQSLDHEIKDFRLHVCQRPTPWEVVENDLIDPAIAGAN